MWKRIVYFGVTEKFSNIILNEIYANHLGMVKIKYFARGYIWWPGLKAEIENTANNCKDCCKVRNLPNKAQLQPLAIGNGYT